MSTSLIVLIPVILLGIVGMLCFVGCVLPEYRARAALHRIHRHDDTAESAIIAYWPLKEAKDTDPAVELISGNNGNYIDPNTAAGTLYPWPDYSIPNGADPDVLSAAAPGQIALAQPTIVVGDVVLLPAILCPRPAWW